MTIAVYHITRKNFGDAQYEYYSPRGRMNYTSTRFGLSVILWYEIWFQRLTTLHITTHQNFWKLSLPGCYIFRESTLTQKCKILYLRPSDHSTGSCLWWRVTSAARCLSMGGVAEPFFFGSSSYRRLTCRTTRILLAHHYTHTPFRSCFSFSDSAENSEFRHSDSRHSRFRRFAISLYSVS